MKKESIPPSVLAHINASQQRAGLAFESACEMGDARAASQLVGHASLSSVGKGAINAAWVPSHACLMVALRRLDAEGGMARVDLAMALRDAALESAEGLAVGVELLARADPAASGWALRELVASRRWGPAHRLLAAGAGWEAIPDSPMMSRNAASTLAGMETRSQELSAKGLWELFRDAPDDSWKGCPPERGVEWAHADKRELRSMMEKAQFDELAARASATSPGSLASAPAPKAKPRRI